MAVKDRSQLLTQNDSVFGNGKNTRGDDEKEFNDDQLDSVVMKSGDTFTAGAEFEFDNGSKLREGAIDHGYGGGIAKVCANEKTDQWEDGFRYLISTSGSTNTVIYVENMNGTNPGDNDDETQSYAIGSRWKNLVSGVEYICTQPNEGDAIWQESNAGLISQTAGYRYSTVSSVVFLKNGNVISLSGSFVYDDSLLESLDPGVNVDSNGIDTMNAIAIGEDGTVVPLITISSGFGFAVGTSCPLQTYYYSFNALLNT
jgi:hypothetical protein